jgi:protein-S-isoprenylcysteine O-methyltransferase Ste14
MQYIGDVLVILILFAIYGFVHSLLASKRVKILFKKTFGELIAFYRLLYNLFALGTLYFIFELSPKPYVVIYDLPNPYDLLALIPQFMALAGLFWAFRYICLKEFIGLNQVKRYFNKNYSSEFDEEPTMVIKGPFRYSRHPVYFFSIIFLLFRPTMDLFYLTIFVCIVVYFYIGSYYEEKKLAEHFGRVYLKYKKSVPRIFPVKLLKPYKEETFAET